MKTLFRYPHVLHKSDETPVPATRQGAQQRTTFNKELLMEVMWCKFIKKELDKTRDAQRELHQVEETAELVTA